MYSILCLINKNLHNFDRIGKLGLVENVTYPLFPVRLNGPTVLLSDYYSVLYHVGCRVKIIKYRKHLHSRFIKQK